MNTHKKWEYNKNRIEKIYRLKEIIFCEKYNSVGYYIYKRKYNLIDSHEIFWKRKLSKEMEKYKNKYIGNKYAISEMEGFWKFTQ